MLAQNFKTPADLGIKDVEFDALLKVLGMLERGELPHTPHRHFSGFNMSAPECDPGCGTVACIAGWARHVSNGKAFPWAAIASAFCSGSGIQELFMPKAALRGHFLERITPAQAAIALRNYLRTGEPNWAEAMAE